MNKNKVVKGLLGVSVAAALFAALAANAQTAGQSSNPSGTATSGQSTSGSSQMGTSQGTKGTASGTGTGQDTKGSASGTSTGQDTKGSASGTSTGAAASLSKSDQKALMDMARANMAEIEAGKMAQTKSQNEQVKSFAQQMIDDHTKALGDVQQVAQAKGVTLPTELDAKHKAMAAKLDKMSGAAFDKAYMAQAGVADHKTVHKMLQKDQKSAKDPDVKALAEKMLPTVEQHLKSAQQIAAAKGGTKAGK